VIFGQDRNELRQMYADAWRKRLEQSPASPLETQIADVIAMHPEYHEDVTGENLDKDYLPDGGQTNPFLHMGLHLAVRDQVSTDRPPGVKAIHRALADRSGDAHGAEHAMIEALAETLWEAQSANQPPDEAKYLERLRRIAGQSL
jgi:hypothetical protein